MKASKIRTKAAEQDEKVIEKVAQQIDVDQHREAMALEMRVERSRWSVAIGRPMPFAARLANVGRAP